MLLFQLWLILWFLWTDKLIGDAIDAKTGISSEIEWKLFTPFIE